MVKNPINDVHNTMQAKARADKEYHMECWKHHIIELCKLVGTREGMMTWKRYIEIRDELLEAADKAWKGDKT